MHYYKLPEGWIGREWNDATEEFDNSTPDAAAVTKLDQHFDDVTNATEFTDQFPDYAQQDADGEIQLIAFTICHGDVSGASVTCHSGIYNFRIGQEEQQYRFPS